MSEQDEIAKVEVDIRDRASANGDFAIAFGLLRIAAAIDDLNDRIDITSRAIVSVLEEISAK